MKLSRTLEQIRLRARDGSLHKLASDLLDELRDGSAASLHAGLTRIAAAFESQSKESSPRDGKTVFNIAIAVAVGVPVSSGEPETDSKQSSGGERPQRGGAHAAGAPAVATASVSPEPLAAVPKAALESSRNDDASPARASVGPSSDSTSRA